MSKAAKKRKSEKRKEAKKARKRKNYIRYGPKQGHIGRRQKRRRYGTFRHSQIPSEPVSPTPPGVSARRRRKGLKPLRGPNTKKNKRARYPLLPLRRR